jgi:pyrroline-5-carboxylate reductase
MKKSIGFIGGGRITRIFLEAFKNEGFSLSKMVVYDVNRETCKKLNQDFVDIRISDLVFAATRDIVIIALHPSAIMDTLAIVKNIVKKETIFISLAPKFTVSKLTAHLGKNVVRFMPNANCLINKGYNPIHFSIGFKEKQEILDLFTPLGKIFETEESKLEAYAVISGMLPTYFWFQWMDLIEIARQIGLSGLESKDAIEQTLHAAIEVMFKSGVCRPQVRQYRAA